METQTLKLPTQVRPQREVITQVQATKDTALKNLESILPKKVSEAFEINGFTGALDVIQNGLTDKELTNFAKTIEKLSGAELPKDISGLREAFNSPEFAPAFIKSFKSSFKAAKENPEAVLANPKEFVRSQLSKLSEAPKAVFERPSVAGFVTKSGNTDSPNRVLAQLLS